MKTSEDWITQEIVDQKANEIMAERSCSIDQVKAPMIAKKLGLPKANGSIYEKKRDWQRRAQLNERQHFSELPAAAISDMRRISAAMTEGMIDVATQIIRDHSVDIELNAARKVADAERHQNGAEGELEDVTATLMETEEALAASQKKVAALTEELAQSHKREERLRGRIEQLKEELEKRGPMTGHAASVDANAVQSPRQESPAGHQGASSTRPTGAPASAPTPPPTATNADGGALAKPDDQGPIR